MKKPHIIFGSLVIIIMGGLMADTILGISPASTAKTLLIVGLPVAAVLELTNLFIKKK